jgi:hypothetical protein
MRYRVAFRQRFTKEGGEADSPETFVEFPDGLVQSAEFVERFEPDNLHGEEEMDEDDDFLPFGTEVWEYEVAAGRGKEFREAIERSGKTIESVDEMEDMPAISGQ